MSLSVRILKRSPKKYIFQNTPIPHQVLKIVFKFIKKIYGKNYFQPQPTVKNIKH